ncbi:hypothetical protein [Cryobacterium sp. SO1]|uniref:hypothetical protein n=1 Tax=Cryobacterium sp. SO1 TaxID=1897061 RepID=UPI001022DB59|nr:hypothetical protein [Cryobacterium sp. SO1]
MARISAETPNSPRPRLSSVWRLSGNRARVIVAAAAVVLVLAVVLVVRGVSLAAAQGDYAAAAALFQSDQARAVQTVTDGETSLDEAIALLAASEGRVLTEQPRLELADAIDAATARLSAAAQELTAAQSTAAAGSAAPALFELGAGVRENARALSAFDFGAAEGVDGVAGDLAAPVAAVTTAMAAWQAEEDRILRGR